MCLALYVGTASEVALLPWSEGSAFGVVPLPADVEAVRGHLDLPEVRELVAWEGCGCGFSRGEFPLTDDADRETQRRNDRSLVRLAHLDARRVVFLERQLLVVAP